MLGAGSIKETLNLPHPHKLYDKSVQLRAALANAQDMLLTDTAYLQVAALTAQRSRQAVSALRNKTRSSQPSSVSSSATY
eukprot:6057996-Prymnesium_polylepis.1